MPTAIELKRIEHQKILIAGHDRRTTAGAGRRQHHIIVAVATNRGGEWIRRHQRELFLEQSHRASYIDAALMEFFDQDAAKLTEQRPGGHDDVVANAT